jgi:hypothetical protein
MRAVQPRGRRKSTPPPVGTVLVRHRPGAARSHPVANLDR